MGEIKSEVVNNIKESDSLKELEKTLEVPQTDNFTLEKQKFDQKLLKGRYAGVVKNQKFYGQIIEAMDQRK